MTKVTIRYGMNREITHEFTSPVTVRDALTQPEIKKLLGLPENCVAVRDGQTLGPDQYLGHNDVIVVEKQAAAKA